jgi:RES domain-containing protein
LYEAISDEDLLRLSTENLTPSQQQGWALEVNRRGYRLVLIPAFFKAGTGTVAVNPWKAGESLRIRVTKGYG